MFRILKVDSLLFFFLLSISLILLTGSYNNNAGQNIESYRKLIDSDYQLNFSDHKGGMSEIKLFNPELSLMVSLDGGDHFKPCPDVINLNEAAIRNLLDKSTSPRWLPNDGELPEISSIRVIVVDHRKKLKSEQVVFTSVKNTDLELPVISINTSEKGLFDWFQGIMVMGARSTEQELYTESWWDWNANYHERGIEWERAANVHYFEEGELKLDQDCGIRISGNATRGFPQKSLRIHARKSYGKETLDYPFWSKGNNSSTSVVLRNSGNDNMRTLFADLLVHQLCRGSKVLVQEGRPVHVFINGNYWGIYNLRERIDENFIAQKEGWKNKSITILEDGYGALKEGSKNEKIRFDKLIGNLPTGALSDDDYEKLKEEISVKSFTDYIIFETFFANQDWPKNNAIWYCKKGKKWKWVLNDLDYSMAYPGMENINANLFAKLKNDNTCTGGLFNALMTNKQFKKKFVKRAKKMLSDQLSAEKMKQKFSKLKASYESEIELTIRRWRGIESKAQWEYFCDQNLQFLLGRREVYKQQLEEL